MKTAVILPVKRYSRAKTRLDIHPDIRGAICHIMLEEMVHTLDRSPYISEIVMVTQEPQARAIGEEVGCIMIHDEESGVNEAVAKADRYLTESGAAMSLVIPQDIPLMRSSDIGFLLKFFTSPTCVLVVPSRRMDGTNALLRCPPDIMKTSYDDNSYRNHMSMARQATPNPGLVHVTRMMMDVDTVHDLDIIMQGEKPMLAARISEVLDGRSGGP